MAQTVSLAEKPAITDLDGVYASRDFRRLAHGMQPVGVMGQDDLRIALTSGRGFSVNSGAARVRGANVVDQGYYRQRIASNIATGLDISANGDANPRLDQIVLRIYDDAYDSSGFSEGRIEVIAGNATASASLANRSGAANLGTVPGPKAIMLLADVLVPGGSPSTIPAGNIRDRRPMGGFSIIPPVLSTALLLRAMAPHPALAYRQVNINGTDHNTKVSAALYRLEDEMPVPAHIRWHYVNGDNAGANPIGVGGTYAFGLCRADGRKILDASGTFSGSAGQSQERLTTSLSPDAGTILPPGQYWVVFGVTGVGAAGTAFSVGATADNTQLRGQQPPAPNMYLRATSGGTGAITTNNDIRDMAFGDAFSIGLGAHLPVPQIVLEAN